MGRTGACIFGMAVIGDFLRGGVTRDVAAALPEQHVEVDTLTIKDLGRWESLEMVQRYTRSMTFQDALKHYRPLLG